MRRALFAGGAYFAIVFAIGFALGVVRRLFLALQFGEALAVGLELPMPPNTACVSTLSTHRGYCDSGAYGMQSDRLTQRSLI